MVTRSCSLLKRGVFCKAWRFFAIKHDLHYLLVGLLTYVYAIRFRGILPTNVNWIFRDATGDAAGFDSTANYLGWEFYRRGDFVAWPIGRSTLLGPEPGASIAMSDSLPLFGIPMKYLTWWTDRPLQYFGVWILLCFLLQAFFAGRILQRYIASHATVLCISIIFPLMPFYLARVGVHTPISGHWILLAAISLLLAGRLSWWRWCVTSAVAIAIQPYLAAMVLVLFVAALVGSAVNERRLTRDMVSSTAAVLLATGVAAHQVGLLVFGRGSLGTDNVGDFSANLLSLVDPEYDSRLMISPNWSQTRLLPNVVDGVYQYEGFGFVGTGVAMLAFVAVLIWTAKSRMRAVLAAVCVVVCALWARNAAVPLVSMAALIAIATATFCGIRSLNITRSQRVSLSVALVCSILLAVTNHVTFGGSQFSYYWPQFVVDTLSIIRVTGRFVWVVAYLAVVATAAFASHVIRPRKLLLALVLVMVVLHLVDTRDALSTQRALLAENRTPSGLEAALWTDVGNRYSRIEIVVPGPTPIIQNPGPGENQTNFNDDFWFAKRALWADMSEFAAYRGMSLNAFYFGREPMNLHARGGEKLAQVVETNAYRDDTLYVFTDSALWNRAKTFRRPGDVVGLLDGIPIVAPGLGNCETCPLGEVQPVKPANG